MKFIIIPDIHYLQDNHSSTDNEHTVFGEGVPTRPENYNDRLELVINTLKKEKERGLDFFISNGDLVHDNPSYLQTVKNKFDEVGVPYYVTYGNHDRATEEHWADVWGHGRSTHFTHGNYAFILPCTSDESGARLPADHVWVNEKLDYYANKKGVFVITHVPQTKRWRNSPDAYKVRTVLKKSRNLIGIICSHVHGAITTEKIDDLVFSMTGHFAHYGRNFYTIRRFNINENKIETELYNVSADTVVSKQHIRLVGGQWKWFNHFDESKHSLLN